MLHLFFPLFSPPKCLQKIKEIIAATHAGKSPSNIFRQFFGAPSCSVKLWKYTHFHSQEYLDFLDKRHKNLVIPSVWQISFHHLHHWSSKTAPHSSLSQAQRIRMTCGFPKTHTIPGQYILCDEQSAADLSHLHLINIFSVVWLRIMCSFNCFCFLSVWHTPWKVGIFHNGSPVKLLSTQTKQWQLYQKFMVFSGGEFMIWRITLLSLLQCCGNSTTTTKIQHK